ncbi:DUF3024 domain-containing protein [Geomonas subterranea]|uniref:DUF3024 domain-containing protein n=1 Tax=Geomonas subterranea TaxID=2847989 RepID=UPI001CD4D0FF
MSLPEVEWHRSDKLLKDFCDKRIPPHRGGHKLNYKIVGKRATLIESRPYYNDPSKWSDNFISQFEYDCTAKTWSLYAYDRNDRRRPYSTGSLEKLIHEVDNDSTGLFGG